jgi:hypothetical protein
MKKILSLTAAAIMTLGMSALANCVDFSTLTPGDVGQSVTVDNIGFSGYWDGTGIGTSIYQQVSGNYYSMNLVGNDMYYKLGGGSENGLGLAFPSVNSQNEIPSFGAIIVDFSSFANGSQGATLSIGSSQSGEMAMVFGYNPGVVGGADWVLLGIVPSGGPYVSFNVPGGYEKLLVSETPITTDSSSDNILLNGVCIPDGGSTAMMLGLALCGMALMFVRKTRTA